MSMRQALARLGATLAAGAAVFAAAVAVCIVAIYVAS